MKHRLKLPGYLLIILSTIQMKKILLVDDEPNIIEFLKYELEQNNYEVIEAWNGIEAIQKISENPDLIVLDIMMPGIDGFEVFEKINSITYPEKIPVIFLTAITSENNEIKALEMGARDYLTKPVSPQKLIARIKVNLNKETQPETTNDANITVAGPIVINTESFTVKVDGVDVFFPRKEFYLLKYLIDNNDKVIRRHTLLNKIWGDMNYGVSRTVDVHISKVREKLGSHADLIETIKGIGYKFRIPAKD